MTNEEAVRLAEKYGAIVLGVYPEKDVEIIFFVAQLSSLIAEVRRKAMEECAITAWNHFMETCKSRGLSPADSDHFCAAGTIRARYKEEGK